MDFFDIHFLDDVPHSDARGCRGKICIGSFQETFLSDVGFWSRSKYESQWVAAASRIMTAESAALVTCLGEPSSSNFARWWALYRDGDSVIVQEQLCLFSELRAPFDPERIEDCLRPRELISEGGQPISEWFTTVAAIAEFLGRRSSR